MTFRKRLAVASQMFTATLLLCGPNVSFATLNLGGYTVSIYQNLTSANVWLGHIIEAGTNMNRLIAGGSFEASCASSFTGLITGERTLSSAVIGSYNRLTVTIPETLPALRNMPGFEQAPRGTTLSCAYRWKGKAAEAAYTISLPGFGFTIGGEERSIGDTVNFTMKVPGAGDGGDRTTCIP